MDDYLDNIVWEEIESTIKSEWDKSTSYQLDLKVELPSIEWFCDIFDYPTSTIERLEERK